MNYLRRLYCYLYGHLSFTITVPQADGRQERMDYCMRCEQSRQLTYMTDD